MMSLMEHEKDIQRHMERCGEQLCKGYIRGRIIRNQREGQK